MATRCSKCDARVLWAVVAGTDKRLPIDPVPHQHGRFLIWGGNPDAPAKATKIEPGVFVDERTPRFTAHTETCPKRARGPWHDPSDPGPREP
jgi:hypothetical protein